MSGYIVLFSKAAQYSLEAMSRGGVIASLIKRKLSMPHETVMCQPLGDHATSKVIDVAGYAVYFRFRLDGEPSGVRYVLDVRLPGDFDSDFLTGEEAA